MTRLSTFARSPLGALPFLALIVSMAGCGGGSGGGEVAAAAAAVPVTTAIARTGEVESRLHSVGRFVSENAPRLAAEVAARVEHVLVEEGETVSAGQVLVRLDPTAFDREREIRRLYWKVDAGAEFAITTPIFDPEFDPDVDRPTYPDGMVPNIGPSGFRQAFTTKCTQCHTQVHGSDLPSQTVPGLGGGLTR